MNIYIFTTIYPALKKYGIPEDTKVIHYFAKEWENNGHHIKVIYLYQNAVKKIRPSKIREIFSPFEDDYTYEGIDVHLVKFQLIVPHSIELLPFQMNKFQNIVDEFFYVHRNTFRPDMIIMHFPMSFYGLNLKKYKIPYIIGTIHQSDLDVIKKHTKKKVKDYLSQFTMHGSRNKKLSLYMKNIFHYKSPIIYSGIPDKLIWEKNAIENKWRQDKKDIFKIIYVGKLIPRKKVDVLLTALRNVKFPWQLVIVGDGAEKDSLLHLTSEMNMNHKVIFTGSISRNDTIKYMRDSDVFVMVSISETLGLVYMEAMAQGCIAVGTKGEGIDGIIKNQKNGFLISPNNSQELTNILNTIWNMEPRIRAEIAMNGFKTARNMTDKKMAEQYLHICKE